MCIVIVYMRVLYPAASVGTSHALLHQLPSSSSSSSSAAAVAGLACMFPYCTAIYGPHEVEEFEAHELSHF